MKGSGGACVWAHLVRELPDSSLIAADSFVILLALLLLHYQLRLQLPHLDTTAVSSSASRRRLATSALLPLTLVSSLWSCFFPPFSAICSVSSSLTCSSAGDTTLLMCCCINTNSEWPCSVQCNL